MRGKVPHSFVHHLSTRITPAYAGKSFGRVRRGTKSKDHPRLCGEKLHCFGNFRICQGSPPPMRGKVGIEGLTPPKTGITPAYAGKRPTVPRSSSRSWDHPRLCGEKVLTGDLVQFMTGITPAYAGKSS